MKRTPCSMGSLVQACLDIGLCWLIDKAESWSPWNDEWLGLIQPLGASRITSNVIEFFRDNGWSLEPGANGRIYMAPMVYINPPAFLYHLTPCSNLDSIFENGLLTGEAADQCTSGRTYCQRSIYVCISAEKAQAWASEKLIGKSGCKEWGMLRITSNHLTGGVYRDPASLTGYILEDKIVLHPELIKKICS